MKFSLIVDDVKIINNLPTAKLLAYARERMSGDEADSIYEFISGEPFVGELTQISNVIVIRSK